MRRKRIAVIVVRTAAVDLQWEVVSKLSVLSECGFPGVWVMRSNHSAISAVFLLALVGGFDSIRADENAELAQPVQKQIGQFVTLTSPIGDSQVAHVGNVVI